MDSSIEVKAGPETGESYQIWYWMVLDMILNLIGNWNWLQPFGIVWYCMVLYYMVLHSIAWYYMLLDGIMCYCMVVHWVESGPGTGWGWPPPLAKDRECIEPSVRPTSIYSCPGLNPDHLNQLCHQSSPCWFVFYIMVQSDLATAPKNGIIASSTL